MEFRTNPVKKEIEIVGFNSVYYFELDKNFSHPFERHDFWEMVYVDSGKINSIVEGIGSTVNQGQLIFERPMALHANVSNKIDPNNILIISFTCHSPAMEFFDKKIFTLDNVLTSSESIEGNFQRQIIISVQGFSTWHYFLIVRL